ncbi:MAG: hypothetical protein O7E51_11435 [Acidobacteria bacterium]|nr:hypothetical protein [Acidobacteriota bacterium]
MQIGTQERGKLIALLALAAICAFFVYRNFFLPEEPRLSAGSNALGDADAAADSAPGSRRASSPSRDGTLSQQQLAALDPTLRVDLLERSKHVKYAGESRNIFQFYTPPPPSAPAAAPMIESPVPARPSPSAPQPLDIPLKFYGVASRPGTSHKKAFLTDGEDIFIGEEGDLIAKRYKIIQIRMNSIEMEDSRDKRRQQLPLIEE